jgi:hypothetical protein
MRLITLSLFTIALFAGGLNAQEEKPSFLENKNQNSFEVETLAAFSYAYAHKFNPRLNLGVRIQFGLGIRILLTDPSFYTVCDQCPAGSGPAHEKVRAAGGGIYFDVLKLQFFYRINPLKNSYFEFGPFATVGYMNEMSGGISTGLEASAFYTVSHFHIGTRLTAGWQFMLAKHFNSNYFGLYSIPIVIGVNF